MTSKEDRQADMSNSAAICRHYTISDLSRILRVTPWRIRRWVKLGLLTPLEWAERLQTFDFHQASLAKRLCELLAQGATLAAVRRQLEQLARWLPEDNAPLARLARLEPTRLLVRMDERLLDGVGQLHFDFGDDANTMLAAAFDVQDDLDELFETALAQEDAGELAVAAETYRRALALDPVEPVLHFNLGNVLYGLGQLSESRASLQQAVQLDPRYAEAWNNLGNVLAELGRIEEGLRSFRQSLLLAPGYELAQANLRRLLEFARSGRGKSLRVVSSSSLR